MAWALLTPAAILILGIIFFPVVKAFLTSLQDVQSTLVTTGRFVGVQNYVAALTDPSFWSSAARTLYFMAASTAVEIVLGIGLALLLNAKMRWPWLFRAIVVLPWALPTIVNAALWRNIFNAQFGPLNALLTQTHLTENYHAWLAQPFLALNMVMVADIWKNTSIVAFFILAGLQAVPSELYEAGEVDGAGRLRSFFSITLPLVVPSIAVVLVLRTVDAFKVFDIIYAMTGGGPAAGTTTIAFYAYLVGFSNEDLGVGAAMSYIMLAVILALTFVYLRLLRKSDMSLI